jgi:predicted nucleic acid-binding protein
MLIHPPHIAVIDTNIFVGACLGVGAANHVIAAALNGKFTPIMGSALMKEYEDVLGREALFKTSRLDAQERSSLLDIFLSTCQWTRIYYAWRPNLPDEGDNHLIELAVAAGALRIVSRNLKHLAHMELKFDHLCAVSPQDFLKELKL